MKRAIACFIALLLGVLLLVQVTPANAATDFIPASLKSVVFDPTYYAANNADVVKVYGTTSAKLYEHFLNYGIKEGRQGSPAFSVKYYWQNNGGKKNPNKAPNYISEMKHFVNSGWKETFRTLTAPHVNIGEKFEARIVGFNGLLVSYSGTNVYADSGTILNKDQIWVFSRNSDGSYRIINKTTGLALSLEKATYVKDTNVCLKKPTSGKEQRWYIYKYSTDQYVLRSLCTPSCVLDIEGAAPTAGTNIDVWTYNGKANQIFSIDKVSALDSMTPVDLGNDFYARIINSELQRALTVSGTNVVTSVTTGNSSQIWRFQKNSDGTYRIVNYAHNKSLDANGGKYTKRTNVGIKANNNSNAQKWYIFQDGAGYAFLPKCSYSCAMDLQGGSLDNGTNVHLWPYDGNRCKIYDIVKVDVKNKTDELTPCCNMACKMCYVRMTKQQQEAVAPLRTAREWLDLAAEAQKHGMLYLLVTGGEPFLRPDIQEIISGLHRMGLLVTINSNGTMIDEKVIAWLKQTPPCRVNVTLYGASDDTYQRLCGNPHGYTQAVRGIRLLKEAGISVKINCSVTPDNVDDIQGILAFAEQEGLLVQATTYMFPPLRREPGMVGCNERLTAEEAAYQSARIFCLQHGEDAFLKKMEAQDRLTLPSELGEDCPVLPSEGEGMRCRAGKCSFWITWDGRMLPCGMFTTGAVDVFREGFVPAWDLVKRTAAAIRMAPKCSKCKLHDKCRPCAAMALTETGRSDLVPEYRCQMAMLADDACKRLESQIRERRREGFK